MTTLAAAAAGGASRSLPAVIIGSGMAGLACSQMLSKYFDNVVVLERDSPMPAWEQSAVEMCTEKQTRKGVTQYVQIHAMTAQGLKAFDSIFGGRYGPALRTAGGNIVDMCTQAAMFHPETGPSPWQRAITPKEPVLTASCTRHLLETTARKLVASNDRVDIKYGVKAAGLMFEGPQAQEGKPPHKDTVVTGVVLADGTQLPAALVVDCSGRGSSLTTWLSAAGYQRPRVSRASANSGYASWLMHLAPETEATLQAANVDAVVAACVPPSDTYGLILKLENGLWMGAVGGVQGVHPEKDDAKLLYFARQKLWHPAVSRVLEGSTILAPAAYFFSLKSVWRHFEDVQLPENLLVLADSICSFNPVYGQGMTVAALEVAALDKLLAKRLAHPAAIAQQSLKGLSNELQQAVLPVIKAAWRLSVGNDMKFPGFVSNEETIGGLGGNNPMVKAVEKVMLSYLGAAFRAAAKDSQVFEQLIRVLHMLDEPTALVQPKIMLRVLRANLRSSSTFTTSSTAASGGSSADMRLLDLFGAADGSAVNVSNSSLQKQPSSHAQLGKAAV